MTGVADQTDSEASGPAPGIPRFGPVASGVLSLLLASSLLLLFPLGLLVAPLALIPVAQQLAVGRRGVAVWGWVTVALIALSLRGDAVLGVPVWVILASYGLVVVVPAISLEVWHGVRCSEGRWAAITTLGSSVVSMAAIALAAWPVSPPQALVAWWRETARMMEESYHQMGVASGQLELALDAVERIVPWLLPALPIAYLVVILFWIRPRLPVLGFVLPIRPFERLRAEEWLPAGFAASGAASLLLAGTPRWVAVNLLIAVLLLYFVQGLAIIRAHLARWIGRGWLVRWVVVLLCLQGPLPLVVAALGLADGFFPLRPRPADDGGET